MTRTRLNHLAPAWIILLGAVACGADHGGIGAPAPGTDDTVGTTGGAGGSGGSDPGTTSATTGSTGGASDTTGSDGAVTTGSSGAGGATTVDDSGSAGGPIDDDAGTVSASCVFHTAPWNDAGVAYYALTDGGDAGSDPDAASPEAATPTDAGTKADGGGSKADAGPATSITVLVSPFLGPYLADSAGRVLYTYGADMPGDCNNIPISGCEADCLIAWPLFEAGARTLPASLNDGLFGTILRQDGLLQTTYYGWPLYYFKTDLIPGMLGGQAKSKTWHAATVIPAGIVIMKGATISRYLGDGVGHTLYVYDQDVKGGAAADPVTACKGTCLDDHPAFYRSRLSVVSSLEPTDFSSFSPSSGQVQLAYKGAPLYYSSADARSGDQNGATTGWSIALP